MKRGEDPSQCQSYIKFKSGSQEMAEIAINCNNYWHGDTATFLAYLISTMVNTNFFERATPFSHLAGCLVTSFCIVNRIFIE